MNIRKITIIITVFISVVGMLVAEHRKRQKSYDLQIVTSFTVLKDITERVLGPKHLKRVQVSSIVKENADPHVYQPTPKDSKILAKANLVIVNGLTFEGWLERLINASGYQGQTVIAGETVTKRTLEDNPNAIDPHAWHNVKNGIHYVTNIANALAKLDPDHAADYLNNAKKYISELESLDMWIHCLFAQVPEDERVVVTTHDAFWYFGNAYAVTFISPIGVSTEAQASAADVAKIIDTIKEHHVKAVFIENLANPGLVKQIASEANVRVDGVLFADSLSSPQESANTYVGMMKHNALAIFKALMDGRKPSKVCKYPS